MEAVIAPLLGFLKTELPLRLAEIDAEYGDGIACEAPLEWIVGEKAATNWPAGWLLGLESRKELEETYGQYEVSGVGKFGLYRHDVLAVIAVTDPDNPDDLRRRLFRYAHAVTAVVHDHEAESFHWIRARVTGHAFTGVFRHAVETTFRQDVYVSLEVSRND